MRRADRLLEIIQMLRDGRLYRARDIADRLGVSLRTVYRDMDTLAASGVPVEGARGVGYWVTSAITLPPLNLTATELEALHLAMAVIGEAADEDLRAAAKSLSAKIDAVLPETREGPPRGWGFAIYPFADAARGFQHMPSFRAAIRARQKLRITYRDLDDSESTRIVRPLQLDYWGRVWTATCWCETDNDFRTFRIDRISALTVLPNLFVDEPGKTHADYIASRAPVAKP